MAKTTRNYFRAGREKLAGMGSGPAYVFFDDESLEDTSRAWAEVCRRAESKASNRSPVCAWRPPKHPGDWDSVQVVGYRTAEQISRGAGTDVEKTAELGELHKMIARRRISVVAVGEN